ncbi:glycosyltransferase [Alteromonas aestuariivivens]|uniref:Glycosyltransferase n=1 Tax=Alteromonas aestuariivivens TaxID=1938339 RepID=A0A3D8M6X1_9ALTE|nr:MJ1255/VC2487 family glycosyltransferase [Alteromonas aestuariivivens]RDV25532.1 glycosyltransferase [Alteromonas aestuariivivens]
MKILYGIQGTGNGHIARARIMAAALNRRTELEVDYLFSGRSANKYFDMEVFGNYETRQGLTFVTRHGQVDKLATFRQNSFRQFVCDVRSLNLSGYDLVLNDFEPISAWAARRQNVPSISISHQAAFTYAVPMHGDSFLDHIIMKFFAPAQIRLGVHWFHFNQPILPPFVCEKPAAGQLSNHILVYLPFEEVRDIHNLLEPLTDQPFQCFHPAISAPRQAGHIQWQPTSKLGFQRSLQLCQGVIANGGFELSSEALQLGKKLLIKPLHGQFEQLSNVLTLNTLGLCQTLFQLDTDIVEEWLDAPDNEAIQFPDDPGILIDWITNRDWHNPQSLCDALWQQVQYGDETRQKLLSLAI